MLTRLKTIWRGQRDRRPWLDHAVRAWQQLGRTNGSLLAGALTFFSFLALFPLILLGVSIAGFVLSSDRSLETRLLNKIADQAPGGLGSTISDAIKTAVDAKTGVGIVALVGLLLTGLGWISNLRSATEQVWGHPPPQRSFLGAKVADLFVLVGLGFGLIVSVALTATGSALTGTVLRSVHLDDAPGAYVLTAVLGILIAAAADVIIFGFLLIRLPKQSVPRGLAVRASVLAAVGFEILKLFGTYYIARVAKSPTVGTFGSIIGVLVWLNLVFRYLLYCTAWTATGVRDRPVVETGAAPLGVTAGMRAAGSGSASAPAPAPRRRLALVLTMAALARRRR